jgi:hypothetical protein
MISNKRIDIDPKSRGGNIAFGIFASFLALIWLISGALIFAGVAIAVAIVTFTRASKLKK